uniref:Uncharacterized protein n=1 Tax=Oryza punctata TaxID=4537 RepID=A0A0E0K170_ORYPU
MDGRKKTIELVAMAMEGRSSWMEESRRRPEVKISDGGADRQTAMAMAARNSGVYLPLKRWGFS